MFDIRYYFCQRGNENFHEFTMDTFQLQFDQETGIAFVKKVQDELLKNHQETDQEIVTGFMPQLLDRNGRPHHLYSVRSFENYLNHLNPNINSLWQTPLKKIPANGSETWYKNVPLGHNPIEKFMSKLSDLCQLSNRYTNHCVWVTGATNIG